MLDVSTVVCLVFSVIRCVVVLDVSTVVWILPVYWCGVYVCVCVCVCVCLCALVVVVLM